MKRKYTQAQIIDAVKTSTSIRQVLSKLGLKEAGGNYANIKKLIKQNNIDSSHFTGRGSNKGRTFGPKRPITEYLDNQCYIISHKLKLRLIVEGYFIRKCYKCNLTTWNGKPIPIELEHIDGNHLNNSLSNLTILCPNCHAQTETYRGKNKKSV